jgi:hypothetical protein
MKYELWGIRAHPGRIGREAFLVAIFSSEKKAKAYVKASLLKGRYYSYKEFRKKSLLSSYDDYDIKEVREDSDYPYDPEL